MMDDWVNFKIIPVHVKLQFKHIRLIICLVTDYKCVKGDVKVSMLALFTVYIIPLSSTALPTTQYCPGPTLKFYTSFSFCPFFHTYYQCHHILFIISSFFLFLSLTLTHTRSDTHMQIRPWHDTAEEQSSRQIIKGHTSGPFLGLFPLCWLYPLLCDMCWFQTGATAGCCSWPQIFCSFVLTGRAHLNSPLPPDICRSFLPRR